MKITTHALARLQERCSLSPYAIRQFLESNQYYPIGEDTSKEHIHKLIYSKLDNEFFVVVQDSSNQDVITILPLDYHNAWKLSDEFLETARQYLSGEVKRKPIKAEPKRIQPQTAEEQEEFEKTKDIDTIFLGINYFQVHKQYKNYVSKKTFEVKVSEISRYDLLSVGFPKNTDVNYFTFKELFSDITMEFRQKFISLLTKIIESNISVQTIKENNKFTISHYYLVIGSYTFSFKKLNIPL